MEKLKEGIIENICELLEILKETGVNTPSKEMMEEKYTENELSLIRKFVYDMMYGFDMD